MEIGSKLKAARAKIGLTQEKVAEELGVSRQSVSNWENNRSYPDIVSVIKMSDLYSISLDELLKEDKKMIEHLDEATNEVKSRKRLSKLIEVGSFLVIWAVSMIAFWAGAGKGSDALIYSILIFYIIMPVSTLTVSLFIGMDKGWNNLKWLMTLFFGLALMLTDMETFGIAWLSAHENEGVTAAAFFSTFRFPLFVIGAAISAVGIGIGTVTRKFREKKQTE